MYIKNTYNTENEQMLGLGTIINSVSIIAGGAIGYFAGKLFKSQ